MEEGETRRRLLKTKGVNGSGLRGWMTRKGRAFVVGSCELSEALPMFNRSPWEGKGGRTAKNIESGMYMPAFLRSMARFGRPGVEAR